MTAGRYDDRSVSALQIICGSSDYIELAGQIYTCEWVISATALLHTNTFFDRNITWKLYCKSTWLITSCRTRVFIQNKPSHFHKRVVFYPSILRARFHCGLWNCIMTGSRAPLPIRAAAMHRVCYSFTLHARSRSPLNTIICTFQQRGRVNIYNTPALRLLSLSNNQIFT